MTSSISIERNDSLLRLYIIDIAIKLAVSPWATGDYISTWGVLVNYACDGILLGIVFVQLSKFPRVYLPIIGIFLFTALTYAMSTFFFTDESIISAMINHLKFFLPFMAVPTLVSLAAHSRLNINNLVFGLCILIIVLVIFGLATLPPSMNRLEKWLPTYFGGLHTTAYVSLMTCFALHALWQHKLISTLMCWPPILFLSAMIMAGWGVRTASLGFIVFILGIMTSKWLFMNRPFVALFFPMGVGIVASVMPLLDFSGSIDQVSSGRISMYIEKYHQLMRNDFPQWFIGNGYMSDLILTDIWWWEAKGAHSDFITFMVEGGIFYFGGFFAIIGCLFRAHPSLPEKLILVAMLWTSMFSNGAFSRPIAAYLLSVVFVVYYYNRPRNNPNAQ